MKLRGVLISQLKDYKVNFSLCETWNKINHFLFECSPEKMVYSEKDAKLYTVLDTCFKEDANHDYKEEDGCSLTENGISLTEDGVLHINPLGSVKLEHVDYAKLMSIKEAVEKNFGKNTGNIIIALAAFYELAEKELDEKDFIINFLKEKLSSAPGVPINPIPEIETDYSDRTVLEFESSDIPYKLKQFSFRKDQELEIKTKKLVNSSKTVYGCVTILILGKDNCVLNTLQLKHGESIYANFIGDEIVEVLPTISCRELHYIYLTKDSNGRETLGRFTFENELSILYPTEELKGITQFQATDDKGFVGIADGKLITYTSSKLDLGDLGEEKPVSVYVRGTSYLLLTNKGNIYSNRNFNHRGVISICFDEYYYAYAITADGRVLSDNPKFTPMNHYEGIVAIYPNNDTVVLRTIQADMIYINCIAGTQDQVKKSQTVSARINAGGIYTLEDGNIRAFNTNKTFLANIVEFDVTDDYIVGKSEEYIYCLELSSMGQLRPVQIK